MSKFGLYGKITVHPGQRDALIEVLLAAAALLRDEPGCEIYLVNTSPTEPDAVWVTEVWRSQADHEASLKRDDVGALIQRGRPWIAGGDRIEVVPVGGKGITVE